MSRPVAEMAEMFPESAGAKVSQLREYVAERMATFEREAGGRIITHIAEGRPYEEIVRLATARDVDLIVIGTSVHSSIFGGAATLPMRPLRPSRTTKRTV